MNGTSTRRLVRPPLYFTCGITLELDREGCTGCGMCVEVCPHGVFSLTADAAGTARSRAEISSRERCMECGACARNCPVGVIKAASGVGCAAAIINGLLRGSAPDCGCGSGGSACCGGSENGDSKDGCGGA